MKIPFSDEVNVTPTGKFEWMATTQPDDQRKTYFESMWDDGSTLLRQTANGAIWGLTEEKQPRKARKGERVYYEFLHTLFSSKRRYPVELLFQESGDGTSFNDLLNNQLDCDGLVAAFQQAGRYKNVQTDGNWERVEQPQDQWEATIDVLLTVTEKDQKYIQTCFPDKFIRTGYTQGITRMVDQNNNRPFIINKDGATKLVHYTIQPQDFDSIPF